MLQLWLVDALLPQHTPATREALLQGFLPVLLCTELLLLPLVLQASDHAVHLLLTGLLCDVSRRVLAGQLQHLLGAAQSSDTSHQRLCHLRLLHVVVLRLGYLGAHDLYGLLFSPRKLCGFAGIVRVPLIACDEFFYVNLLLEDRAVFALDGDFEFATACRIGLLVRLIVGIIRAVVIGFRRVRVLS